jgi:CheY-like chemotaxis protein
MARILVVEDNAQNLKLTTIILQSAGHVVTGAVDSVEADRALAREIPDLIIMDVALPGKDGYSLTRELRQKPATSRLPILALSAFAMPGDAEKALQAGCTDYLTKPVRRGPLLERVARLLAVASHRAASEAAGAPEDSSPAAPSPSPADEGHPPSGGPSTVAPAEAPAQPTPPPEGPGPDTPTGAGLPLHPMHAEIGGN